MINKKHRLSSNKAVFLVDFIYVLLYNTSVEKDKHPRDISEVVKNET